MKTFVRRLGAVLALDTEVYDEILQDPATSLQAVAVVVLSSLPTIVTSGFVGGTFTAGFVILLWGAIAVSLLLVNRVIPQPAPKMTELISGPSESPPERRIGMSEVLRATGFAYAPRLFAQAIVIPLALVGPSALLIGQFVELGAGLWVVAAYVASISNVFDTSFGRAFILIVASWVPLAAFGFAVGMVIALVAPA